MSARSLVSAIALVGAASAAPTVTASAAVPPRAVLGGMVCERGANPLDRAVAIVAVMRPLPGTERMELRFQLERRAVGTQGFTEIHGGDLGQWRHPTDPSTLGQRADDVWRLDKQVANLTGPAAYRFRVTFRWTGNAGHELGRVVRLTAPCDQPR
jgi:hypothetical protein